MRFSTSTLGTKYNFQPKSVVGSNHLGNVLTVVSDRKIAVASEAIVQLDFNSCTGACGYQSEITPPGTVLNVENVAGNNKLHVTTSYRYDGAHLYFNTISGHNYVISYEVSAGSTPNMGIYAQIYQRVPTNAGLPGKWVTYGFNSAQFTAVGTTYDLKIMKASNDGTFEDFYIDNVVIEDLNGSNANYMSHFTPEILSATDYYAFGAPMNGRQFNSNSYKYGFNGKEKDDETNGAGNSYDFGARMYDGRLGRWLSVDPEFKKFPSHSVYHAFYNSPIIVIDKDGKENVVIVGSDCHLNSGQTSFLEAGLNQAIEYKKNRTEKNEQTSLVVYKGDYSNEQMKTYKALAKKNGINFIEAKTSKEVEKYVNEKSRPANGQNEEASNVKDGDRKNDPITDFAYVGHGTKTLLLYEANNGKNSNANNFSPEAFSSENCNVDLKGCQQGELSPKANEETGFFPGPQQETVFDHFKEKIVSKGTITGAKGFVNWEKGGKCILNQPRTESGTANRTNNANDKK